MRRLGFVCYLAMVVGNILYTIVEIMPPLLRLNISIDRFFSGWIQISTIVLLASLAIPPFSLILSFRSSQLTGF